MTPLLVAIEHDNLACVKLLLKNGANVMERAKAYSKSKGYSPLHYASRSYCSAEVAQALLGAGADIEQQAEALINLLNIRRTAMSRTVELYNNVRAATEKEMGAQNMTVYLPITMPEKFKEAELLLEPGFVLDE